MNDEVAAALVKKSGNPRWVYDTYRRFIQVGWLDWGAVFHGIIQHPKQITTTHYK